MAEGDDDLEKTEEPTPKKLRDAAEKGQVAFSKEVNNFLYLLILTMMIIFIIPFMAYEGIGYLSRFIGMSHDIDVNPSNLNDLISSTISEIALIFMIPVVLAIIAAFASSLLQNGVVFSTETIMPKLEKISVMKGLERMFSMKSLMEFVKGLLKITMIAVVAYLVFRNQLDEIIELSQLTLAGINALIQDIAIQIMAYVTAIVAVIAVIDFSYQKYEFTKSMRMSIKEVKEELKQSEGDPQIKAKLRQIREERAKKRMMSKVPEADVVIRNPTHYAIALEYKQEKMNAPVIVAMGQDNLALTIIEKAEENQVPVVTNRTLAKALYESAELDEEIPLEHYKAVAEIIAYVYKMEKKSA